MWGEGLGGLHSSVLPPKDETIYPKDTEPLYHSFVYSLASLLSGIYPFFAMHSLHVSQGESVTYI